VIRKAIKQVRITGRANPNLIIMHPDDWEKVVNAQASDGQFLINILQDQVAPRIAGLRVVECDAITAGKPMVVDTSFFPIALRQDVTVDFTNSDGEKFAQLIRTARAYVRAGIKHRRPAALCGVTGF
jgi:HK97 family phage major capsid protein